jgi:hypothetical protein
MPSLEELSYDVAVRALAQQERLLDDLRARTGTLLTAAALIGSFLGAQAIRRHGLSMWVVLAFVAFALTIILSVYVLLPKAGLIFALDAPQVYEALYDVHADQAEVHRRLAYWVQTFRLENQGAIVRMTRAFGAAAGTLLVELALLGLGLALH